MNIYDLEIPQTRRHLLISLMFTHVGTF